VDILDKGVSANRDTVDSFTEAIREQQAAILEFDTLSVVLSALKKTDGVSVISNPKMIVTSGDTNAFFSVGERYPIIRTEIQRGTVDSPGDKEVAELATDINMEYIQSGYLRTGIDLQVVPIVKTDEMIETAIMPSLRRRLAQDKVVGGNSWPIISVKEIRTRFTLRSGQTVAIGGLTDTQESKQVTKVPLLGNIPIIGKYFFTHTQDLKSQNETIIFVTLSLAAAETLREESGIPQDAKLVHRELIKNRAERERLIETQEPPAEEIPED
jgi:type II secretory pathway component GspD/PulD (secretin)